jgi:uncharacterized membrane protein YidH (DUF202 family)
VRGPGLLVLASLLVVLAIVLSRDPEEPWALGLVIVALGVATAAGALAWQQRAPRGARRRTPRPRPADALRRAVETGAIVSALLWLRAVDGLSPLTGIFVVAAFVAAELVLSARPQSSR